MRKVKWSARHAAAVLVLAGLGGPAAFADLVQLVKDINQIGVGPAPEKLVTAGGVRFFVATDGPHGQELWKTDGTAGGTTLVKDIWPGETSSSPDLPTAVGNSLHFRASDPTYGQELWKSDGTLPGTTMVKDIYASGNLSPAELVNVGGLLYFSAEDHPLTNGKELWKSDGTASGTVLSADVRPGPGASSPQFMTPAGNTLFFRATDRVHGVELWSAEFELAIGCQPTSFSFSCQEGSGAATATLLVSEATATGTLNYRISATPPWLSCMPTTGSSTGPPTTHTVRIDPSLLNAGSHAGTITVTAAGTSNSPFAIPVSLSVSDIPPTVTIDSILPNPADPTSSMPVDFRGTAVDAAGTIAAHLWSSDLHGYLAGVEDFSILPERLTVGAHTVTFTAWDEEGTSASDTASLTVLNVPPAAQIVSMVPNPVAAGGTVTITLGGWDRDEMHQSIVDGQLLWPDGIHTGLIPGPHQMAVPWTQGAFAIRYRTLDDEGTWSAQAADVLYIIPPAISCSPTTLALTCVEGRTATTSLTVWNSGMGMLAYSADAVPSPTLAIAPPAGLSSGPLVTVSHTVTVDASGLLPGDHAATITLIDPAASNSPMLVPVTITVTTGPVIGSAPPSLRQAAVPGADATTQTVHVWNAGRQTLSYVVETTPSWLLALPAAGISDGPTSRTPHRIGYRTAALPDGEYAGTITITDVAARNNPVTIPVSLKIGLLQVVSILRLDASPTSAASVAFEVGFGEDVSGVDVTDFDLVTTGVAGATVTGVSAGPATYTVTVDTGSGDGEIRLDLVDDDSILDFAGNPLGGAADGSYRRGEVYAIDKTAPTVAMSSAAPDPTNASPIPVSVIFDEPVTGFDASDVMLINASMMNFGGSGAGYRFDLEPAGDGPVLADIAAGVARDAVGNGNVAAYFSCTFDATPPETAVDPLPTSVTMAAFNLPWSGSDNVSGVASVQLFYRRGATGAFAQYGGDHTASLIVFNSALTGGDGHYGFYTIGTDRASNVESEPAAADAQVEMLGNGPAAPRIASEPTYVPGTVNTIWFAPPEGATACYLEWATCASFCSVLGESGWLPAPQSNYTVRNLLDRRTYFYRVKARNEALIAGPWSRIVSATQDASPPASYVVALPSLTVTTTFTIRCSEIDALSGVKETHLYYRLGDTGPYTLWPEAFTTGTVVFDASLAGGDGLYQFYSIAEDVAGNVEETPPTCDAQTVVNTGPPGPTRVRRWVLYR